MIRYIFLSICFITFLLPSHANALTSDGAYGRVKSKKELNCGVIVQTPYFSYDKKGKPIGFTPDLFAEIALRTGVRIKYTLVTGLNDVQKMLNTGKLDMMCTPLPSIPATSMKYLPGQPLTLDMVNVYTLAGTAGPGTAAELNIPKYVFGGIEGELGALYTPILFPKAQSRVLREDTTPAQMIADLKAKKSHYMIMSDTAAASLSQTYPGILQPVLQKPLFQTAVKLFYPQASTRLYLNIEATIDDMKMDGRLNTLLDRYGLQ